MTKFLKRFSTHSEYSTYINGADKILPNVSFCQDNHDVHYNPWEPDYTQGHLAFVALEDGTFSLTIPANINTTYMTSVSYSVDNGSTWVTTDNSASDVTITTPTITTGNVVLWKGSGKALGKSTTSANYSYFSSTGEFNVVGNIMSLLYEDDFLSQGTSFPTGSTFTFCNLFSDTNVIDASSLNLAATTLVPSCYYEMFRRCLSLTDAPALPATTLADNCYTTMFNGCTSLTTAPELPAVTLGNECYAGMFNGCTSLTTAPDILPAMTLTNACYASMFSGCTSLTTAPILPATTLSQEIGGCYEQMFKNCTSLNYVKAMLLNTPGQQYTGSWLSNVAATGTFVKNSAATWTTTGVDGIPTGWTVETASQ